MVGSLILVWSFDSSLLDQSAMSKAALVMCFLILLTTVFETVFAYLFKAARSPEEEAQNIYFASDDPKWIFINRITLACVSVSYGLLIVMSMILILET